MHDASTTTMWMHVTMPETVYGPFPAVPMQQGVVQVRVGQKRYILRVFNVRFVKYLGDYW